MGPIPFHPFDFNSEEAAVAAVDIISSVIAETSDRLGLDLRGLDGVTVAHDYNAALANLDRGVETTSVLTATKDGVAEGVAMAPLVCRDGKIMSHLVLSAALLPTIEQPALGVDGKYIIAHELAHIHEHYCRDRVLPNTLLQPFSDSRDPAIIFQMAEASWCEYAACFISAPVCPEQARLYEAIIIDGLPVIRERIIAAKLRWVQDKDFDTVLSEVATYAGVLLKYISYLLGHAAGLDKTPEEIAPQAWALLHSHRWLYPWVERVSVVLRDMLAGFERWTGMNAFDPLNDVARGLLADCGITITLQENGSLYVFVSPAKL